ncbi:hypothetical protein L3Y34_019134 [Caenorhabditis briggsae]|uniref:Uncharacterized protein n=2 Tax=Caenorhabditis briggsae TaxID=6238 RepID=A0AAE9DND8_CAEBR|nr:hypothetical protein L3Y34_019134 [Caenorhabditis briggsae]
MLQMNNSLNNNVSGQGQNKKEGPPPVHVPIEPVGMNAQGTMHFSQGILPSSCWLVVPVSPIAHSQVPVPQIQVMNSGDHQKIIDIAFADLAFTTKMKCQKKPNNGDGSKDIMSLLKEQFDRGNYNRTLAMLNNSGAPSSTSTSPVSMSPRASNDR